MGELNVAITCRCNTFGRRSVEEALYSFLLQEYNGPKELLIVNDNPVFNLHFSHPEVTVINHKPFESLGDKYNFSVEKARYDTVFTWDDDDIFLPWALQKMADKCFSREFGYGVFRGYFVSQDNKTMEYKRAGLPQGIQMFTKKTWEEAGKYPKGRHGSGLDRKINAAIDQNIKRKGPLEKIHKWGEYIRQIPGFNDFFIYRQNCMKGDPLPDPGEVILKPRWDVDWIEKFHSNSWT